MGLNMNKNVKNNRFDEVQYKTKLKKELQIRLPGYGEKRSRRATIYLKNDIYKKTMAKCKKSNCTLNEAVNQLLYIWSKGVNINETNNNADNNESMANSFYKVGDYGEKRDKPANFLLEPTIFKKVATKCERGGYTLTDAVNKILYIWTQDEKDIDDNNEKNNQTNVIADSI